eukprot:10192878-Alexandrium_andersonii.AAC.1
MQEFKEHLTELWRTWAGKRHERDTGPASEPDRRQRVNLPHEGRPGKAFHEQDFIRFEIDPVTPEIEEVLDARAVEDARPRVTQPKSRAAPPTNRRRPPPREEDTDLREEAPLSHRGPPPRWAE